MASLNTKKVHSQITHEGAKARKITAEQELRRTLLTCMLWEDNYYEDGISIAERIKNNVLKIKPEIACEIAVEARTKMKLRHAPLLITNILMENPATRNIAGKYLERIIERPDEITEAINIYWKDGRKSLPNQMKKGLGKAFCKFNAYQLAKYRQIGKKVSLRDAIRLVHPKPSNDEQSTMWKQLVEDTLPTPDTWEVNVSDKTKDPQIEYTRLLTENKMGALAILRNLRNFSKYGVDENVIREAIKTMKIERVLPFRFLAAALYAPFLEPDLEEAMYKCLHDQPKIKGRTVLLIDVSGSMLEPISSKSDLTRKDTAVALAILLREICDDIKIYTFSADLRKVPTRRGFALRSAINASQSASYTYLGKALDSIQNKIEYTTTKSMRQKTANTQNLEYDRLIVITDEQSQDSIPNPTHRLSYMINVASYQYGVGYAPWRHIDGWSESVVNWIQALEFEENQ